MDQSSNINFQLKWGIIGTGRICKQFARCFRDSKNGSKISKDASQLFHNNIVNAVLSRSIDTAISFSKEFEFNSDVAVSTEQDFYSKDIDIVYIGSINTEHYRQCKIALEKGKSVLCEKPLVMNAEEALELRDLAKSKGVFLLEGLWSRFFPIHQYAKKLINEGIIGDVKFINSDLGTNAGLITSDHRMVDPSKGGSALRDVGIYILHMISFYLEDRQFDEVKSFTQNGATGVDYGGVFAIKSKDVLATGNCTFFAKTARTISIYGTKGNIIIEEIHNPKKMTITLFDTNVLNFKDLKALRIKTDRIEYDIEIPFYFCGNGLEYEIEHVYECIRNNRRESNIVPLDTSVYIQSIIDEALKKNDIK